MAVICSDVAPPFCASRIAARISLSAALFFVSCCCRRVLDCCTKLSFTLVISASRLFFKSSIIASFLSSNFWSLEFFACCAAFISSCICELSSDIFCIP
uniref:Uncharacterized protein n=1 Tax=uncultured marine virus TaxID=186617 RepID=A0A0F7L9I8_9VIRU|nr:hypothetical protein [uncultured marine virus]